MMGRISTHLKKTRQAEHLLLSRVQRKLAIAVAYLQQPHHLSRLKPRKRLLGKAIRMAFNRLIAFTFY
ncbi:hypothetical protein THIOM_004014 [Candidatus Thiomargarita nelsonii]|uniref:Transposase n=1 Tax=Candidatus Thiomargarita nelsonii TaxID=1003181 RepID=A0A176RX31_9GAMM|nr:hypothetical protein THIOM_004014 [Candidatus Thiomargarita nelsonii]